MDRDAIVKALVTAAENLEAALQGDSLGDVDGARDALANAVAAFKASQRRNQVWGGPVAVQRAAQVAREVFDGHKRAKEAVDYMEQLLLAAFRGDATGGEVG